MNRFVARQIWQCDLIPGLMCKKSAWLDLEQAKEAAPHTSNASTNNPVGRRERTMTCRVSTIQEPRKGGFSKGGFCTIKRHSQQSKEDPRILDAAVHLASRAPQPREAYMFANKIFQKKPFSWFLKDLVRQRVTIPT